MPQTITEKLLARVVPSTTDAVLAYTPPDANTRGAVKSFKAVNTSASTAKFTVYFMASGASTPGPQFAIFHEVTLEAGETLSDETFLPMGSGDSIYVQTNSASGVNFFFFGYEVETT